MKFIRINWRYDPERIGRNYYVILLEKFVIKLFLHDRKAVCQKYPLWFKIIRMICK